MKLFISWSKDASKECTIALREFLPLMVPGLEVFMTESDIELGEKWEHRLAKELQDTSYGLICLTPDNLESVWIHFEAGAITKHTTSKAICLLLGEIEHSSVKGPLSHYQNRKYCKVSIFQIASELNAQIVSKKRTHEQLSKLFKKFWPDLDKKIQHGLANISTEINSAQEPALTSSNVESSRVTGSFFCNQLSFFEEEFAQPLENRLPKEFSWPKVRSHKAIFVLRELVANAMIHGGHQHPKQVVNLECEIGTNSLWMEIQSPGKGFSRKKISSKKPTSGLLLVEQIVSSVSYGRKGRRIRAVVPKHKADSKPASKSIKQIKSAEVKTTSRHLRLRRSESGVLIVETIGEKTIDPEMIQEAGKDIRKVFDQYSGEALGFVFDMRNVTFLSSAMINKFIKFQQLCEKSNVEFAFSNLMRLFEKFSQ